MKRQKMLIGVLCCCVLVLCVAAGIAVHFWRENVKHQEQATIGQERIEELENQLMSAYKSLSELEMQLTQEEKQTETEERIKELEDKLYYVQLQYEVATRRDNPIDRYISSPNRPDE